MRDLTDRQTEGTDFIPCRPRQLAWEEKIGQSCSAMEMCCPDRVYSVNDLMGLKWAFLGSFLRGFVGFSWQSGCSKRRKSANRRKKIHPARMFISTLKGQIILVKIGK